MKTRGILRADLKTVCVPILLCIAYFAVLFFWDAPYTVNIQRQGDCLAVLSKVYIAIQYLPAVLLAFFTSIQYEETFRPASKEYLRVLCVGTPRLLVLRPALTVTAVLLLNLPISIHAEELLNVNLQQAFAENTVWNQPIEFSATQIYLQCVFVELFVFGFCLLLQCLTGSKPITLVILLGYFALEAGGVAEVVGEASPFYNAFAYTVNYRDMPGDNALLALGLFVLCYLLTLLLYRYYHKRR